MSGGDRDRGSVLGGLRHDVQRLHRGWMDLLFPRQFGDEHPVLGRWRPETQGEHARFWPWWVLGAIVVGVGYPLALCGFAIRFYSRKVDRLAVAVGVVGVLAATAITWGVLALFVRLQLSNAAFLAVVAAGITATISAGVALLFTWWDGRLATVGVAYPAAVTTIFLPPVVVALFSTGVASDLYPIGEGVARFVFEAILPAGMEERLRGTYDFDPGRGISAEDGPLVLTLGTAQVLLWLAISVPLGWTIGLLVTLAEFVRPSGGDADD
jgi:hypothetical protein